MGYTAEAIPMRLTLEGEAQILPPTRTDWAIEDQIKFIVDFEPPPPNELYVGELRARLVDLTIGNVDYSQYPMNAFSSQDSSSASDLFFNVLLPGRLEIQLEYSMPFDPYDAAHLLFQHLPAPNQVGAVKGVFRCSDYSPAPEP